jgi:hypothetical protein
MSTERGLTMATSHNYWMVVRENANAINRKTTSLLIACRMLFDKTSQVIDKIYPSDMTKKARFDTAKHTEHVNNPNARLRR